MNAGAVGEVRSSPLRALAWVPQSRAFVRCTTVSAPLLPSPPVRAPCLGSSWRGTRARCRRRSASFTAASPSKASATSSSSRRRLAHGERFAQPTATGTVEDLLLIGRHGRPRYLHCSVRSPLRRSTCFARRARVSASSGRASLALLLALGFACAPPHAPADASAVPAHCTGTPARSCELTFVDEIHDLVLGGETSREIPKERVDAPKAVKPELEILMEPADSVKACP